MEEISLTEIFRISVAQGWTRNMDGNARNRAVRLNYRNAPASQPLCSTLPMSIPAMMAPLVRPPTIGF